MRILDPNRGSYKRKFADGGSCVFCDKAAVIECESLNTAQWRVIVNKYPYMDGNLMLVPVRHVETTDDLTNEEWVDFGASLNRVKAVLGDVFEVDSFNVGINLGPQSGGTISHIHWQIVPRKFKNISTMNNLADLYVVEVTPEETKKRLDDYIAKQKS